MRRSMTAVRCAALTASAFGGLASVASPAPARRAAPAASRAAPVRVIGPETTRTWPRRYLCASHVGRGSADGPQRRRVLERARADRVEDRRGNADVDEAHRAARGPAGIEQVAGLLAKERDAGGRRDAGAGRDAGVGAKAAGQVDGEDRRARGVGRGDEAGGRAFERPVEAGAEQRVHDQRRRRQRRRRGRRPARTRPRARSRRRRLGRAGSPSAMTVTARPAFASRRAAT